MLEQQCDEHFSCTGRTSIRNVEDISVEFLQGCRVCSAAWCGSQPAKGRSTYQVPQGKTWRRTGALHNRPPYLPSCRSRCCTSVPSHAPAHRLSPSITMKAIWQYCRSLQSGIDGCGRSLCMPDMHHRAELNLCQGVQALPDAFAVVRLPVQSHIPSEVQQQGPVSFHCTSEG